MESVGWASPFGFVKARSLFRFVFRYFLALAFLVVFFSFFVSSYSFPVFCSLTAYPSNFVGSGEARISVYYSGVPYPTDVLIDCGNGRVSVAPCAGGLCYGDCYYSSPGLFDVTGVLAGFVYCSPTSIRVNSLPSPSPSSYPVSPIPPRPSPTPGASFSEKSCFVSVNPSTVVEGSSSNIVVSYSGFDSVPSRIPVLCGNGVSVDSVCSGGKSGSCFASCSYGFSSQYPSILKVQAFYQGVSCTPAFIQVNKAPSSTGSVSLEAFDCNTGRPIQSARISLTGPLNQVVYTDSFGKAFLEDLPPGVYSALFSKEDYSSSTVSVIVSSGKSSEYSACLSYVQKSCRVFPLRNLVRAGEPLSIELQYSGFSSPSNAFVYCGDGRVVSSSCSSGSCIASCVYEVSQNYPIDYSLSGRIGDFNCVSSSVRVIAPTSSKGSILSRVTDCSNGNPVSSASVLVGGSVYYTDSLGNALIQGLEPGVYQVNASKTGFGRAVSTASVEAGKTTSISLCLDSLETSFSSCDFSYALLDNPGCFRESVSYRLSLRNNLDRENSISVRVSFPFSYSVPSSVLLSARESKTIDFSFSIPVSFVGSSTALITLVGSDSFCSKSFQIPLCAKGGLELVSLETSKRVFPNSRTCFGFQVKNTGSEQGLVSLIAGRTNSGTSNLRVYVRDSNTSQLVSGALVSISGSSSGSVLTDSTGIAYFAGIPSGQYLISVTKQGYSLNSTNFLVSGNEATLILYLSPSNSRKTRVAVVGFASSDLTSFLESNSFKNAGIDYVGSISIEALSPNSLDLVNVTILNASQTCSASSKNILRNFVDRGGKLIFLSDSCNPVSGDSLYDVLPVSIREKRECSNCAFRINYLGHPLFSGVNSFYFNGVYSVVSLKQGASLLSSFAIEENTSSKKRFIILVSDYEGKPLSGALVRLFYSGSDLLFSQKISDSFGKAVFEVNESDYLYPVVSLPGYVTYNGRASPVSFGLLNTFRKIVLQPITPINSRELFFDSLRFDLLKNAEFRLPSLNESTNAVRVYSRDSFFVINSISVKEFYFSPISSSIYYKPSSSEFYLKAPVSSVSITYLNAGFSDNAFSFYSYDEEGIILVYENADISGKAKAFSRISFNSSSMNLIGVNYSNSINSIELGSPRRQGFVTERGVSYELLNSSSVYFSYPSIVSNHKSVLATESISSIVSRVNSIGSFYSARVLFLANKTVNREDIEASLGLSSGSVLFYCSASSLGCGDDVVFSTDFLGNKSVVSCMGSNEKRIVSIADDFTKAASDCELISGITPARFDASLVEGARNEYGGRVFYSSFDLSKAPQNLLLNAITYLNPLPTDSTVVPSPTPISNQQTLPDFSYEISSPSFILAPNEVRNEELCVSVPSGAPSGSYSIQLLASSPLGSNSLSFNLVVPVLDVYASGECASISKESVYSLNLTNNIESGDYSLELISSQELGARLVQDKLYNFGKGTTRVVYLTFNPSSSGTFYPTLLLKKGESILMQKSLCFTVSSEGRFSSRIFPSRVLVPSCGSSSAVLSVINNDWLKGEYRVSVSPSFNSVYLDTQSFDLLPGSQRDVSIIVSPDYSVSPGDYVVSITVFSSGYSQRINLPVRVVQGCQVSGGDLVLPPVSILAADSIEVPSQGRIDFKVLLKNNLASGVFVDVRANNLPSFVSISSQNVFLSPGEQKEVLLSAVSSNGFEGIYPINLFAETEYGVDKKELIIKILEKKPLSVSVDFEIKSFSRKENYAEINASVKVLSNEPTSITVFPVFEGLPLNWSYSTTPRHASINPGENVTFLIQVHAIGLDEEKTLSLKIVSQDGREKTVPITVYPKAPGIFTGLFVFATSQLFVLLIILFLLFVAAYFIYLSRKNVEEIRSR